MKDSNTISVKIDGMDLSADPGRTILEIARENGIEIPTLCHDARLNPTGSCLLCVVEVKGMSKLALACATKVTENMEVETRNERVILARRKTLELLLSNHFADCVGPCAESCPAGVNIQGYLALAKAGKYLDALELIRQQNPFPGVCGRVCVRYCELACRRQDKEAAVSINAVKRYLADLESSQLQASPVPPWNWKKVAIVGGGPCGLTAAYFLAKSGYRVTVYDAHPKLGGMLRYGIPDYRLPQDVLDAEIDRILDHGVEAKLNHKLGTDFTLDSLKKEADAIFLALGAQKAKKMNVDNEQVDGVIGGIEYLETVKKDGPFNKKGTVVVVGGGNTAIDAARTAIRGNASKVVILYRRTLSEMPADHEEVEDALAEGIEIQYLTAPMEIVLKNDRIRAVKCQRMELGKPDESGRRRPVPVANDQFDIVCNQVIAAIGQNTDLSGLDHDGSGITRTPWNTIKTKSDSLMTSIPGIFAGGDVVSGPAAAVDAIGHGRKAANEIIAYLTDSESVDLPEPFASKRSNLGEIPASHFDRMPEMNRVTRNLTDADSRVNNFNEVDQGISKNDVFYETSRCLSCGCSELLTCDLRKYATEYQVDQEKFSGKARKYKIDDRHPLILLDPNKCILCGKCVRVCDERIGVAALGFVNRGYDMMVRPSHEKALQDTSCISCGNCIDVCPTGGISYHLEREKSHQFPLTPHQSVCNFCGAGCEVVFSKKNDEFWNVSAVGISTDTPGEICGRGRFGHRQLIKDGRIRTSTVKRNNQLIETSITAAINQTAESLSKIAERYGEEKIGFFVSPNLSNEEIFLARKIARKRIHTSNLASTASILSGLDMFEMSPVVGVTASTIPQSRIEAADLTIVINSNVLEENPVTGFKLKRAVRAGSELITISATETELNQIATGWVSPRRGTNTILLNAISAIILEEQPDCLQNSAQIPFPDVEKASEITGVSLDEIYELAGKIADVGKNVVFFYNRDSHIEKSNDDLRALTNLLLLTGRFGKEGNGLILGSEYCNSQGFQDFSDIPDALRPEDQSDSNRLWREQAPLPNIQSALLLGDLKGVVILGESQPFMEAYAKEIEQAEFVAVMDTTHHELLKNVDVLLPGSVIAESEGSVTAFDRCVRVFSRVFDPPSEMTGFEILNALDSVISQTESLTLNQLRQEMVEMNPLYEPILSIGARGSFYWNETRTGGETLYQTGFLTKSGKAIPKFNTSEPVDFYLDPFKVFSNETRNWYDRLHSIAFEKRLHMEKPLRSIE